MINAVQNTSPLITGTFPGYFQENGPQFTNFVKAYFQWMEQQGGPRWYTRQIYQIKDIDQTMDQFLVYFKEKYLKNIQFQTASNVRTIIKHALDIYRSKGTERCTTLLFQLAYDTQPKFYYPSTDLMRLSDGQWLLPTYLELWSSSTIPANIEGKEVQGLFSGATAFVDSVVRQKVGTIVQDVAYISAVNGQFEAGERIVPIDGSIPNADAPRFLGSLNDIEIAIEGSGQGYSIGTIIPVSSTTGSGGIVLVTGVTNSPGVISTQFVSGGWGYAFSESYVEIGFDTATSSTIANNSNIYNYYSNGSLQGAALITDITYTNSTAGSISGILLSGTFGGNTFYTYANAASANITISSVDTVNPTTLYISNATITLDNMIFTGNGIPRTNFTFLEDIIQPQVTINYVNSNGAFANNDTVSSYDANGDVTGEGLILGATESNTTTGILIINVLQGEMSDPIYSSSNVVVANIAAVNGISNTTATAQYIANTDTVILALGSNAEGFIVGETVSQWGDVSAPVILQKEGAFGIVQSAFGSSLMVNSVSGCFIPGLVFGNTSGLSANIVTTGMTIGVVNTTNQFIQAPSSYFYSDNFEGSISQYVDTGTGFSANLSGTLDITRTDNVNIDLLADYANVALDATEYGFPADPVANATTGTLLSCLNYQQLTLGQIDNIIITGSGLDYTQPPLIIADNPLVSDMMINDDVLQLSDETFSVGEFITQGNIVQGIILSANSGPYGNFITVRRGSFKEFSLTVNTATQIVSSNSGAVSNVIAVDYNYFSQYMGRNTIIDTAVTVGLNALSNVQVISSGFGFSNNDQVAIGSNGAIGTAVVTSQGIGQGYYQTKGGFLSDQKKLFDGYFWQNFSYQIISNLLIDQYYTLIQELTHPAGTIMFGGFVYNTQDNDGLNIQNALITIPPPYPLALDGKSAEYVETDNTPLVIPLTTTKTSGIIVVAINSHDTEGSVTVTAPGLTFTQRIYSNENANEIYIYYAKYTAPFANNITLTDPKASGYMAAVAFGVSGATGFDSNTSLPATSGVNPTTSMEFSTTAANTFAFYLAADNNSGGNPAPTGWTLLGSVIGDYMDSGYIMYASSQSNTQVDFTASEELVNVVIDALVA